MRAIPCLKAESCFLRHAAWNSMKLMPSNTETNPETLEGIFDPFFTARPWEQGAGLSLATVYGMVKQSHGHISVDSKPERGTTFHVYLPAQAVPLEHGKEQAAIQVLQGKERILIVEDEPQLRTLTRTWLEGLGYSVLEAASASEAI